MPCGYIKKPSQKWFQKIVLGQNIRSGARMLVARAQKNIIGHKPVPGLQG